MTKTKARTLIDLLGQRFGYWLVERRATREESAAHGAHGAKWLCVCDCGGRRILSSQTLRAGDSKSCGCQTSAAISAARRRPGVPTRREHPAEYRAWANMIQRCENPSSKFFNNYGGRGIRVSEEWRRDFSAFLRDMGPRPSPGHSVDRIDTNGNYTHLNCRWATRETQNRNRRDTRFEAHEPAQIRWLYGLGYSTAAIADFFGVHRSTIGNITRGRSWLEAA